ncbi:MAG: MAPEG family protein [SAR324 cluster bacterium]|nr:MAPEG family protein [SAR324 cluster bacterium]
MITPLYIALSAILVVVLSIKVMRTRGRTKIYIGDGGNEELSIAIGAHSNATQYLPIALLLLFSLEYNQVNLIIVNVFGIFLLIGRLFHVYGLYTRKMRFRSIGMKMTIGPIVFLSLMNLVFLPWNKMLEMF